MREACERNSETAPGSVDGCSTAPADSRMPDGLYSRLLPAYPATIRNGFRLVA